MSLILNIDTAGPNATVSVSRDGLVLFHLVNNVQKDHAAFLHVACKELVTKANVKLQDFDAIAVSGGPGSYTGLRVGFSAAKGLSYALRKPLIVLSTLKIMAAAAAADYPGATEYLLCPMIDARRDEVFTAMYNAEGKEVSAPHAAILSKDSFVTELQENKIVFSGSGAGKFEIFSHSSNAFFSDQPDTLHAMSRLAFESFSQKIFTDTMLSSPLYVKEFYNG